jgi:hypothetical protein
LYSDNPIISWEKYFEITAAAEQQQRLKGNEEIRKM